MVRRAEVRQRVDELSTHLRDPKLGGAARSDLEDLARQTTDPVLRASIERVLRFDRFRVFYGLDEAQPFGRLERLQLARSRGDRPSAKFWQAIAVDLAGSFQLEAKLADIAAPAQRDALAWAGTRVLAIGEEAREKAYSGLGPASLEQLRNLVNFSSFDPPNNRMFDMSSAEYKLTQRAEEQISLAQLDLRERVQEELAAIQKMAITTATNWLAVGDDLVTLGERAGHRAERGAVWASSTKLLQLMDGSDLERLAAFPREVRLSALAHLGTREASWVLSGPGDVGLQLDRVAEAMNELSGDFYPTLADSIARAVGGSVVSVASERGSKCRFVRVRRSGAEPASLQVPRWEFLGLERSVVSQRFREALGEPPLEEPVLFVGGDGDYTSRELLPDNLTARTFDRSLRFVDEHLANLRALLDQSISTDRLALFNFLPASDKEIDALGAPGSYGKWRRIRQRFERVATEMKLSVDSGGREALLDELRRAERDVIVVVAHGSPNAIYTSPTDSLTLKDVLDLPRISGGRAPVVVLLACRTGEVENGSRAIAQALLYRGYASAVVAPTRFIEPHSGLADFLRDLASGKSLSSVLRNRPQELELWVQQLSLPGLGNGGQWSEECS